MQTYDFRVRFQLLEGDRIDEGAEEVVIADTQHGSRLRVRAGESGVAIKDRSSAVLLGGPYDYEQQAREAAERARRALLIWAVEQRVGVDMGDGKRRGGLTDYGRANLGTQLGLPTRDDIHGVDVFPHREDQKFFKLSVNASLSKSSRTFIETIATHFGQPIGLSEKQVLSAELYCSSFFDVSFRSRFITLVTAIEALLDPAPRPAGTIAVVDLLVETVRVSEIDASTREAMRSSLQWLRQESIGQAGRQLATNLLPGREYEGRTAAKFFSLCYELRSQILHSGRPSDSHIDLL